MDQAQLQDLLQRFQQGSCTPEEQQLVEAWYEKLGEQEVPQLPAAERQVLQATLWHRIAKDTVAASPSRSAAWWQGAPVRWAAAAVLAIGFGTAGLNYLGPTSHPRIVAQQATVTNTQVEPSTADNLVYANTSGQVAKIHLQDGSTVELAPGSRLQYPRQFGGPTRHVYLTGEALFDIHHDTAHPFLVVTDKLVTTVLGTRFTVQAYADQPQALVKVRRGKVRVTPRLPGAKGDEALPPTLASVVIRPNQQAVYSPTQQALKKELVEQPAVLVAQPFAFDDRPVSEVLTALERAYGVDIIYDEAVLDNCTVSLVLKDASLFDKLAVICKTLGASYELLDTQIVVHSRGCKS